MRGKMIFVTLWVALCGIQVLGSKDSSAEPQLESRQGLLGGHTGTSTLPGFAPSLNQLALSNPLLQQQLPYNMAVPNAYGLQGLAELQSLAELQELAELQSLAELQQQLAEMQGLGGLATVDTQGLNGLPTVNNQGLSGLHGVNRQGLDGLSGINNQGLVDPQSTLVKRFGQFAPVNNNAFLHRLLTLGRVGRNPIFNHRNIQGDFIDRSTRFGVNNANQEYLSALGVNNANQQSLSAQQFNHRRQQSLGLATESNNDDKAIEAVLRRLRAVHSISSNPGLAAAAGVPPFRDLRQSLLVPPFSLTRAGFQQRHGESADPNNAATDRMDVLSGFPSKSPFSNQFSKRQTEAYHRQEDLKTENEDFKFPSRG